VGLWLAAAVLLTLSKLGAYGTQHDDTQHDNAQDKDNQHDNKNCDILPYKNIILGL